MKIPLFSWAQNDTHVFIDINLPPSNDILEFINNKFKFNNDEYELNFKLYKGCKTMKVIKNRIIEVVFEKDNSDEWSRLTDIKNLYKNHLSVNWNKMSYEDEEPTEQQPDFSQMMAQMQANEHGMSSEDRSSPPEVEHSSDD